MTPFDIDFGRWSSPQWGASNPQSAYLQNAQSNGGFMGVGTTGTGTGMFPTAPQAPVVDTGGASGLGFNTNTLQLGLGGLQLIGNLWNAFQAQKLAREQLNFQKDAFNQNMTNQIQSYNTSLADRIRARGFTEGQSQGQINDYIKKNSLVKM